MPTSCDNYEVRMPLHRRWEALTRGRWRTWLWRHQVDEEERQPAADEAGHDNSEDEECPSLLGACNPSPPVVRVLEPRAHHVGHRRPGVIPAVCPPPNSAPYDGLPYDSQVGANQETGGAQSASRVRLFSTTWTTGSAKTSRFDIERLRWQSTAQSVDRNRICSKIRNYIIMRTSAYGKHLVLAENLWLVVAL